MKTNYKPYFINIDTISDKRGILKYLEEKKTNKIFKFKRIYFISNVPKSVGRGYHAHKKTVQCLLTLNGNFDFCFFGKKKRKNKIKLTDKSRPLIIPKMCWHWMENFSNDCIIGVIASSNYNEKDYIRDFDSYKELIKKNNDAQII
tara:strand:- start:148 stop:585 length:438 start_codon:yes stop_codon:yes gene_type:complete